MFICAYGCADTQIATEGGYSMTDALIAPSLEEYLFHFILPRYQQPEYDEAHNIRHIRQVIFNSMSILREFCADLASLDPNMVFTIAAYHDAGIPQGRENHHITSARILFQDGNLSQWFDADQTLVMKEAVEDHRASAEQPPRSLYGCIVSEADRITDPLTVIQRTMAYGYAHYPELDFEAQFERAYTHIRKKYGPDGYARFCLQTRQNTENLKEIQKLLENKKELRVLCRLFADYPEK